MASIPLEAYNTPVHFIVANHSWKSDIVEFMNSNSAKKIQKQWVIHKREKEVKEKQRISTLVSKIKNQVISQWILSNFIAYFDLWKKWIEINLLNISSIQKI